MTEHDRQEKISIRDTQRFEVLKKDLIEFLSTHKEESCLSFAKHILPVLVALGLLFGAIAWMINSSDYYQNKNIERLEEKIDDVDNKVEELSIFVNRNIKTEEQLVSWFQNEAKQLIVEKCGKFHPQITK